MLELPSQSLFHDRYRIVRLIKAGGMGAVYEAIDTRSDRRRALKVLLPSMLSDDDVRARFDREARVTGTIESDHLVEVSDAGVDPATNAPFIAMELLRGEDVSSILKQSGRIGPGDVVTLLGQAALALDKTHAAGVIHRDLKPDNLFVTRREDGSVKLKVLDFGAAKKLVSEGIGASTRILGTPLYMAPEQARGRPDVGPTVDVYALGHIAFIMLVGRHYWRDEIVQMDVLAFLLKTSCGNPEPATARAARAQVALPPAFDAWFAKATALEPAARFQTAGAAIAALGLALGVSRAGSIALPLTPGAPSIPAPASTLSVVEPRDKPLNWIALAVAACAGLALAGLVLFFTLGRRPPTEERAAAAEGPVMRETASAASATSPPPSIDVRAASLPERESDAIASAPVSESVATSSAAPPDAAAATSTAVKTSAAVTAKATAAASVRPKPEAPSSARAAAQASSAKPKPRGEGLF